MSRKEISGQGRAFHSFTARELRIRRNFVSISVLQRCPILDTEGRGRERCLRWTNTHVYRRCRNVQLFGRVLNARRHTSNANTRIAHYTPAAPIVLLPPVRSSSPLLPPHYNRLRPMIFAFLWITFTMVHELFLILHRHRPEKFISNNNLITKSMEVIFYWTNVEWFFFFFKPE